MIIRQETFQLLLITLAVGKIRRRERYIAEEMMIFSEVELIKT